MIPMVQELRNKGYNILIGSGEEHLAMFREEFADIKFIRFPGFRTGYSRFLPQYLHMLLKTPWLLYHSVKEHYGLKHIIREYNIDIVISDNRFGLWNKDITTVYVTHMPRIPFPVMFRFLEFTGIFLHRLVIKRYTFCLIPDLPGEENLSGRLSHNLKLPANTRYTGILSRFMSDFNTGRIEDSEHNTVILSGPEPQRTILKNKLIPIAGSSKEKYIFLEGKPQSETLIKTETGNIVFYNHLPARLMKQLVKESSHIICRSGYSTLMDLVALNRSALVIPTPGQTEQEYLAHYLAGKGWCCTVAQKKLDVNTPLFTALPGWPDDMINRSKSLLSKVLEELSDYHHKKE